MLNTWNVSAFLFSLLFFCGAKAADISSKTGFVSSLQKLNTYQAPKDCFLAQGGFCPQIMSALVKDEKKDRAGGLIKANIELCKKEFNSKEVDVNTLSDPRLLQKAFQKNSPVDIGNYSNSVAGSCVNFSPKESNEILSKFYYYNNRLNQAAIKTAQDGILISRLLGKPNPECPAKDVLQAAETLCHQMQACPPSPDLNQLTKTVTADYIQHANLVDKIKKLPKDCDTKPECKEQKDKDNLAVLALVERNPWFLNSDFRQAVRVPMKERLKTYLEKSLDGIVDQQKKLEFAAQCIHGQRGMYCDMDDVRETLANTPEVAIPKGIRKEQNLTSELLTTQSCIEEWTLEKNRVGKVMTDFYWDAGLAVATVGLSAITKAHKVVGAANNLYRMMGVGAEATNFAFDIHNAATGIRDAVNVCGANQESDLTKGASKLCDSVSAISSSTYKHGSCLLQASFAAVGVGVTAASANRIGKIVSATTPPPTSLGGAKKASSEMATAEDAASAKGNKRRVEDAPKANEKRASIGSSAKEAKQEVKVITEHPAMANIPKEVQLSEVTRADGSKVMKADYAEKLPSGEWVKNTMEVPIDAISGAINANFTSGREFFDMLARQKAGKAYLAFIDVGILKFVNDTFKLGSKAGDAYIKAVAEEILKIGKGKVTLARLGGDEFGLIIDSTDPAEVKAILEKIQKAVRDTKGDAHKVFRDEKIARAADYKDAMEDATAGGLVEASKKDKAKAREKIDELAKYQQPDISVGATQIGHGEDIKELQEVAEKQAKQMKIETALNFGRSAVKYGVETAPRANPLPTFVADIPDPATSNYWVRSVPPPEAIPPLSSLRQIQVDAVAEVKRVGSVTLIRKEDELGRKSYVVEEHIKNALGETEKITKELPINGATGLLDARHPDVAHLFTEQIKATGATEVIMPKLESLKYFNYFEGGTAAGDEVLKIVADTVKADMRSNDLSGKLAGADFIWSVGKGGAENLAQVEKSLNDKVAKDPKFIAILEKEKKSILDNIEKTKGKPAATAEEKSAKANELKKLNQRLGEVKNFKPDIKLQSASSNEIKGLGFSDIVKVLEDKFKAARAAAGGK